MSFRKKGQCVLLWLSGFCAFSCSVKEDRSDCPCLLALDLQEIPAEAYPLRWQLRQGAYSDSGSIALEEGAGVFHLELPRGGAQVYAVTGDLGLFDEGFVIPTGHGCPPVSFWCASVDARGESAAATVRLRKEHCVLTLRIFGSPHPRAYRLLVEGNVAGYDALGRPSAGPFRCEPSPPSFRVLLPRQTDDSLLLNVYDAESDAGEETVPLRTFALGHASAASGYDWMAPDLADLTLELDFEASTLSLRTDRWTRFFSFEVLI